MGGDIIVIDDALKAEEALSDAARNKVNSWYDTTLGSRINSPNTGSIIIIMQRLHANDLVAHVQEKDDWEVLSFAAIAEKKETYNLKTHYGRAVFSRKRNDVLHPAFHSRDFLEKQRRRLGEYNFAAQYQQNPTPPGGLIVRREWLTFYSPGEKPDRFDHILQSWDTAAKDNERASFSACTTWGIKGRKAYLLHAFHGHLEFPDLKRHVVKLAETHAATVVLVEDKSSGISLIQDLRADGFLIVQAAPALDGDKISRLRGQTAKIEGGFVLFPKKARWLDHYLHELLMFPNLENTDQVDSTVYALAWLAANPKWSGSLIKRSWLHYYTSLPEEWERGKVFMSWDIATEGQAQSEWSVCTVWVQHGELYYLIDMVRGLFDYPDLRDTFIELGNRFPLSEILIEDTEAGKALTSDIDIQGVFSIKTLPIHQDREGRIYGQQYMFKKGVVLFPKDASFMRDVESELLNYPQGDTDDVVDSISQALTIDQRGYDTTLSWVDN